MKEFTKKDIVEFILVKYCNNNYDDSKIAIEKLVDELFNLSTNTVIGNERTTYIIRKYFGILDNGKCQGIKQISEELGISQSRIYIIISQELKKLSSSFNINSGDICKLNLPQRIQNLLIRNNIRTINQLLEMNTREFFEIKGLGKINSQQIIDKVHELGYIFADETEDMKKMEQIILDHNEIINREKSISELLKKYQLLQKEKSILQTKENIIDKEINDILMSINEMVTNNGKQK